MSSNKSPPKIFFFSFDERWNYFLSNYKDKKLEPKQFMNNLITKINEINPDIIVSSATYSLSCTKDHLLHHFMHLIDERYKSDRNKNYKDYVSINNDYKLLAKADSVRKKNSSTYSCLRKKISGDLPSGVRMIIFERADINSQLTKNIKNMSFSGNYANNSNYNELFTTGKNCTDKFCVTKIGFKRYSALTGRDNNTILFDFTIKKDDKSYRYFFIYSKYFGSINNRILNNSKLNNRIILQDIPFQVEIFIINYDSFDIKYAKYEENSKIDLLNLKKKLIGFKTVNVKDLNSTIRFREIKYINTDSMSMTNYNPNELSRIVLPD
jgi:hypothetical protein